MFCYQFLKDVPHMLLFYHKLCPLNHKITIIYLQLLYIYIYITIDVYLPQTSYIYLVFTLLIIMPCDGLGDLLSIKYVHVYREVDCYLLATF